MSNVLSLRDVRIETADGQEVWVGSIEVKVRPWGAGQAGQSYRFEDLIDPSITIDINFPTPGWFLRYCDLVEGREDGHEG